ncbi:MAG: hypothetical protein ACFFCW_01315 [Candidatus Hodarchaeota archaeon]
MTEFNKHQRRVEPRETVEGYCRQLHYLRKRYAARVSTFRASFH